MKALCLLVAVVALSAVAACSQAGRQTAGLHFLDERVPQLPNGASIEEVEDALGPPRNRAEVFAGTALYYGNGRWLLLFDPGLKGSARSYKTGYWPPGKPVDQLDQDVHKLKLRSSLAAAERRLGKPESWEIDVPEKKESLWYGPGRWRLIFSHESLVRKVLYVGGSPVSHP
jgi:hypothetical protein